MCLINREKRRIAFVLGSFHYPFFVWCVCVCVSEVGRQS